MLETDVVTVLANGNDVATTFSFDPVVVFGEDDLTVIVTDTTGAETTIERGTGAANYSITVTEYPGTGSITYPASGTDVLATGESIAITRTLERLQQTSFENEGGYNPDTVEQALDRIVAMVQEIQADVNRAIQLPLYYAGNVLPETDDPTVGYYLKVNAAGTGLEWSTVSTADADASDTSPVAVSLTAAAAGVGADFSRYDHVHLLPTVSVAKGGTGSTTAAAARSALAVRKQGLETEWIRAKDMTPATTNGAAAGTVETAGAVVMYQTLDFDTTTQEFAHFNFRFPKRWDLGTVTFAPIWTCAAGSAGDTVVWAVEGVCVSNDDTLAAAAWGTAVTSSDVVIATGDNHTGPTTSAMTFAGTPVAGDLAFLRVKRNVASDNLAADARLIGIVMHWTANAEDDT